MKPHLTFILLFLLFSSKLFASTPQLWFSDQPPDKSIIKNMRMRHGGYVHIVDGVDVKQLWLRQGNSLHKSNYLNSAKGEYVLLDVQEEKLNTPQIDKNAQKQKKVLR